MQEGKELYEAYQKAMQERGCEVMDWDDLEEIDRESYQQAIEEFIELSGYRDR